MLNDPVCPQRLEEEARQEAEAARREAEAQSAAREIETERLELLALAFWGTAGAAMRPGMGGLDMRTLVLLVRAAYDTILLKVKPYPLCIVPLNTILDSTGCRRVIVDAITHQRFMADSFPSVEHRPDHVPTTLTTIFLLTKS
eukprot:scaffold177009_cov27-Prasinocladus_malaysianus.AAC.1